MQRNIVLGLEITCIWLAIVLKSFGLILPLLNDGDRKRLQKRLINQAQ